MDGPNEAAAAAARPDDLELEDLAYDANVPLVAHSSCVIPRPPSASSSHRPWWEVATPLPGRVIGSSTERRGVRLGLSARKVAPRRVLERLETRQRSHGACAPFRLGGGILLRRHLAVGCAVVFLLLFSPYFSIAERS